jgi:hypothetical protein
MDIYSLMLWKWQVTVVCPWNMEICYSSLAHKMFVILEKYKMLVNITSKLGHDVCYIWMCNKTSTWVLLCLCVCKAPKHNILYYYYTLEKVGSISNINTGGCKYWPDTWWCSFNNQGPAVWLTTKHMTLVSSLEDHSQTCFKNSSYHNCSRKTWKWSLFWKMEHCHTECNQLDSVYSVMKFRNSCHIFISSIQKWTKLSEYCYSAMYF